MTTCRTVLVLGGARSGKSAFAQRLAESSTLSPTLIATAEPFDAEMKDRIARHKSARGPQWSTCEEPLDLRQRLVRTAAAERITVVDCLTVWLANLMVAGRDPASAIADIAQGLDRLSGPTIFVSNEVGSGIVPDNAMARDFRDHQGRLNQLMGAACDRVVLVTAGCAMQIKPASAPDIAF